MREQLPKDKHRHYPKIHDDLAHADDDVIVSIVGEAFVEGCGEFVPGVVQTYGRLYLVKEAVEQKTHGDNGEEDESKQDAGFDTAHLEHSVHLTLTNNSDYN